MGGLVVVGSCNGMVRALALDTGKVRWETKVSPDAEQYFFHSDPFVSGGVIVAGADRASGASLHAFDVATGREVWRLAVGRGVNGPLTGIGNRVYAGTLDGQLLSVDVKSGTTAWSLPLKIPGWEGPGAADDRVVAGTADGSLYALDGATGREQWRTALGAAVTTTVSASVRDAYVGTADGSVHLVDAQRGTVVASLKLDTSLIPASAPVRTENSLLVLLTDRAAEYRALVAVDAGLTRVLWRVVATASWLTSRAFIWGDVVVVGSPSGEVAAYCHTTGAPAWSRTVTGRVRSIGGGRDVLLVGTQSGGLYAMRPPRTCDRE